MKKGTLGVIGGMGVQATALFYEYLINLQSVQCEQEYLDVLIYSKPSIPDRTAFIVGKSDVSPLPALLHAAEVLETAKVDLIALPCVSSHHFYDEIASSVGVPMLHMPNEIARAANGAGFKKIGILATSGTMQGRMFHKAFEPYGIEIIEPDENFQVRTMDFIYDIKKGGITCEKKLELLADSLTLQGAQTVVLGCTELSLAARNSRGWYIDSLKILAQAALR